MTFQDILFLRSEPYCDPLVTTCAPLPPGVDPIAHESEIPFAVFLNNYRHICFCHDICSC